MPHEVIMPALGMAQDTGKIVSWLVNAGDAVKTGDALFEVETDKAVVEVEAPGDGFLTHVKAGAGEDVPVGQVIAMISETADANDDGPAPAVREQPDAPASSEASAVPVEQTPAPPAAPKPQAAPGQRILASPKLRHVALERGLDLKTLVDAGHAQPFHMSDLGALERLSRAAPAAAHPLHISARVPMEGSEDFIDWMNGQDEGAITPATLWVSFVSAAMRQTGDARHDITIQFAPLHGPVKTFVNPDLTPGAMMAETGATPPSLILRDLSDCAITGLQLSPTHAATLSVAREGADYTLSLDFTDAQISQTAALALIAGFADRLIDPLHHLL